MKEREGLMRRRKNDRISERSCLMMRVKESLLVWIFWLISLSEGDEELVF